MAGKRFLGEGKEIIITPLGAGNEVGRSCIVVEYQNKKIMLDCGLHPANTGLNALPFFDEIDPEEIDAVLITHFHLDHAASLPYFTEKTKFKGKVYMTHPTKAIYRWLLSDYVRVTGLSKKGGEQPLYTEEDLIRSYEKIIAVDYYQKVVLDCGIQFTSFNAGHVLGAAMFILKIGGKKILYTGDYSTEEDRHLVPARIPEEVPDILISESTYGTQVQQPKESRERIFTEFVDKIVSRGGKCLIPVFAVGRVQELLLILEEYWEENERLHRIPIYYTSPLAQKCMTIYQTYINTMNKNIRNLEKTQNNPFMFKHVQNISLTPSTFQEKGGCVMVSSPGMLQSGTSREFLELWCSDKRNGVLVPGYVLEGTLGKEILSLPNSIKSINGETLSFNMSVSYISFSAHVDCTANTTFIESLKPPSLILVHGEKMEMHRLQTLLERRQGDDNKMQIYCPQNCESISIPISGTYVVKVIGEIYKKGLQKGSSIDGLLVGKCLNYFIVSSSELGNYASICQRKIIQSQKVRSNVSPSLVEYHVRQFYGERVFCSKDRLSVGDVVLSWKKEGHKQTYLVSWEGGQENDMLAESFLAAVLQAEYSMASVKVTSGVSCSHSSQNRIDLVKDFLSRRFDSVSIEGESIIIENNEQKVLLSLSESVEISPKDIDLANDVLESISSFLPLLDAGLVI